MMSVDQKKVFLWLVNFNSHWLFRYLCESIAVKMKQDCGEGKRNEMILMTCPLVILLTGSTIFHPVSWRSAPSLWLLHGCIGAHLIDCEYAGIAVALLLVLHGIAATQAHGLAQVGDRDRRLHGGNNEGSNDDDLAPTRHGHFGVPLHRWCCHLPGSFLLLLGAGDKELESGRQFKMLA